MKFLIFSLLLFQAVALGAQLPPPTGPNKNIGTYALTLTDSSRTSGFGGPNGVAREIVVQAFYPLPSAPNSGNYADWAPPLTVSTFEKVAGIPNGTLSGITTNSFVQPSSSPVCPTKDLIPLVFSTGMGGPRAFYTTFYEQLASAGYFLLAVDHPYDALIVEYPEPGKAPTYSAFKLTDGIDVIEAALRTRVADLRFLAGVMKSLPCGSKLQSEKAGVFGHSLGGATSAGALIPPSPYKAGLNMDGTIFNYNTSSVAPAPFLIMGAGSHNSTSDSSWALFKKLQKGWVKEAIVEGFGHGSFGDGPTIIEMVGLANAPELTDEIREILKEQFGSLSAERGRLITGAYTEAFFGWALNGQEEGLVAGNNPRFPEVEFV